MIVTKRNSLRFQIGATTKIDRSENHEVNFFRKKRILRKKRFKKKDTSNAKCEKKILFGFKGGTLIRGFNVNKRQKNKFFLDFILINVQSSRPGYLYNVASDLTTSEEFWRTFFVDRKSYLRYLLF